ncbi:hypothetical protein EUGRSUZ_L00189 [Eucalyptus grandis]|uniref:DC1 domain-containing protein n=1 Tax=Eucalyptus grandis TaxID=71139 RepID=A0A058ZVY0_EUCGR|nr:hypothetical protein EUGRSUZ_L00189 [Eucalyptus grandis]
MSSPTYPSASFLCCPCHPCTGISYSCAPCDFDLHRQPIRTIHHELHPEHPLHFLPSPPYEGREFTCNACGDDGDTSSYNCSIHQYDLYAECTDLATRAKRKDHEHPHIVLFPDARIEPDLTCQESIAKGCWRYYCTDCDYGTDLDCVEDEAMEASVDNGGDETEDIGLMMMMLQHQMKMQSMHTSMVSSSINRTRLR